MHGSCETNLWRRIVRALHVHTYSTYQFSRSNESYNGIESISLYQERGVYTDIKVAIIDKDMCVARFL